MEARIATLLSMQINLALHEFFLNGDFLIRVLCRCWAVAVAGAHKTSHNRFGHNNFILYQVANYDPRMKMVTYAKHGQVHCPD